MVVVVVVAAAAAADFVVVDYNYYCWYCCCCCVCLVVVVDVVMVIGMTHDYDIVKNQIKLSENIELSYVWDHTIMKSLNHDIQSKMGNMIKEWVVVNKLENFNSLLKYTDDDFTPTGNLCYINQNGEKLHRKLMKQFCNLRWFIQHLIDENEYQYDDNEWTNPLSESNWTYQINKTFMKYVNFTLKEMTPEQLKQNPITVHPNQNLDTEEGESNTDEQEFTTSEELTEECSTSSDMSKQNS